MKIVNEINKRNRIEAIDIARGIGILLVVIGHVLPTDNIFRLIIYSFHMPLFFFLSGIVMHIDDKRQSLYRIVMSETKLFSDYLFYSAIYLIYDMMIPFIILREIKLVDIFLNFYRTIVFSGINVLWFIATLFLGKIIVKYIIQRYKKTTDKIILIIILYLFPYMASRIIPAPQSIATLLISEFSISVLRAIFASSYILCGYILKNQIVDLSKNSTIKEELTSFFITSIAIAIGCIFLKNSGTKIDLHQMHLAFAPIGSTLSYLGIYSILMVSKLIERSVWLKKILKFWGMNSLLVMVTHEYFKIKNIPSFFLELLHIEYSVFCGTILDIIWILIVEVVIINIFSSNINKAMNKLYLCINRISIGGTSK